MGRPWEYPRWKRALMQVTMWLIFGGTLGLAHFVSSGRRSVPQASLGPPQPWGRLIVRVPRGWDFTSTRHGRVLDLEAMDPQDPRRIVVLSQEFPASGAESPPGESDDENAGPSSESIEFTGLGERGTLLAQPRLIHLQQGGPPILGASLSASTRLPDGLGVTVEVLVVGTRIGSADLALLREIVANIRPGPQENGGPGE